METPCLNPSCKDNGKIYDPFLGTFRRSIWVANMNISVEYSKRLVSMAPQITTTQLFPQQLVVADNEKHQSSTLLLFVYHLHKSNSYPHAKISLLTLLCEQFINS